MKANVQDVARAIGLDQRIGKYFLHPGSGSVGSYFPKDTLVLSKIGEENGIPQRIVETVIRVNDNQNQRVADQLRQHFSSLDGKTIGILRLTFK